MIADIWAKLTGRGEKAKGLTLLSVGGIVIGNALPIYYFLHGDKDPFDILYFYWLECAVLGVLTVVRLLANIRATHEFFKLTFIAAGFGVIYCAGLYLNLFIILMLPQFLQDLADNFENGVNITNVMDPLAVVEDSMRPGMWGCLAGFFFGQGLSFFKQYSLNENFRTYGAAGVIGHVFQRQFVLQSAVGIAVCVVFMGKGLIWVVAVLAVLKTFYDLWENATSFSPLHMFTEAVR